MSSGQIGVTIVVQGGQIDGCVLWDNWLASSSKGKLVGVSWENWLALSSVFQSGQIDWCIVGNLVGV